ncbi:hypothetical protein EW146_g1089 [Bondarzewia mesenterica]|uniref:Uncharacterized protein n=1 Tax=Bondarzewia mesenterica TaxID=1095465 RepID=A0A4S4M4Z1_9AGAM|nr:hypothetical protein EW146_g1089 [Bondarzewia mesenterica]
MATPQSNGNVAAVSDSSSPDTGDDAVDKVVDAIEKVSIQTEQHPHEPPQDSSSEPIRPFIRYDRALVLALHKSPLVKPPDGMPALKDWFGDWNEQYSNKKDPEPSATPAATRDRRFRRDQEDGGKS